MVFETNGRVIVGRILNLWDDEVAVSSNMADPKTLTTIKREEIDRQYPSKESIMPAGLLDSFESNDILDLLAFLRSGGNAEHPLFQPQTSSSP